MLSSLFSINAAVVALASTAAVFAGPLAPKASKFEAILSNSWLSQHLQDPALAIIDRLYSRGEPTWTIRR